MRAFNIKVGFGKQEVTLTILPADKGQYIVIYFGGVIGAVKQDRDGELWEQVPDEDIVAGNLPLYESNLNSERLDFVLCEHTINHIGEEIIATLKDEISTSSFQHDIKIQ